MYELHLFIVKLIVTFSSSVLVFSVGMFSLLDDKNDIKYNLLIAWGWAFSLASIVLIVLGLILGLSLTYKFYNNIINGRDEITQETNENENKIHILVILASLSSAIGVILILAFAYLNFLK
jgi:hypothetical protein